MTGGFWLFFEMGNVMIKMHFISSTPSHTAQNVAPNVDTILPPTQ